MDISEKLVELIGGTPCVGFSSRSAIEHVANWLVQNDVTVQEWISVKDRLPTFYDADADNCVLAIHKASNKRYYHWRSVADNPFDFTYWMKTPQPPKGE